ncbi:MAG: T9SS type A sorting domain-containing protein [Candidatus Marinimicrobia bacterium]|nr:T9SS type A sorting domain-containing protein [Candidatus Neomarinimicrobiota bacterium]MBL7009680.1 T9SS type A sorting domain-containing protein [Candidatus Neomarinimicrobiota bacterium]MBL7029577.1 T9SS type A sorting domain-containing protein [Candidatus Neomarinimicrobiota bacterium]
MIKQIGQLLLVVIITLSQVAIGQKRGDDFFVQVIESSLSTNQAAHLAKIRNRETSKKVRIVRIQDVSRLLNNESIQLNIFPGKRFTVNHDKTKMRGYNQYSWYGKIPGKQGHAIIVFTDKGITGSVWVDMELYQVEPLGSGAHAIIHIDQSQFPPEHQPLNKKNKTPQNNSIGNEYDTNSKFPPLTAKKSFPTNVVIDVMVAYTQTVANLSGDINALIQLAVDETNQGYINSNVDITINLVHKVQVNYTGANDVEIDLNRFKGESDGYMDEIHGLRDQYLADIAMLLIPYDPNYCGMAYDIPATESTAFGVVRYDCATGYYSFGHEIGHLYGTRHDRNFDNNNSPAQYGHGYVYTDHYKDDWRTIMSLNNPTDCSNGYCPRLLYWSNPNIIYAGVPMGTATYEDNGRLLNERKAIVAGFRSIPPFSVSIVGPGELMEGYTGSWTASVSGGSETGALNYEWDKRNDGSSQWVSIGTGTTKSVTMGSVSFTIKVEADRGTEHAVNTLYVWRTGSGGFFRQANVNHKGGIPETFSIYQNHPNPFNPTTMIKYSLPEASSVSLDIYDLLGSEIFGWSNNREDAGYKQVTWNGKDHNGNAVPAGIYIYKLTAKSLENGQIFTENKKMVLLK